MILMAENGNYSIKKNSFKKSNLSHHFAVTSTRHTVSFKQSKYNIEFKLTYVLLKIIPL